MNQLEKYLKKVIEFILHGNLFISCCAVALLFSSYYWMGIAVHLDMLALFIFSSTLFQYTIHRLFAMYARKGSGNKVVLWSNRNQFLLVMIAIISGGAAANLVFHLQRPTIIALIPLGIFSLLYEIPLFKFQGSRFKLRNLPFFKIVMIVTVWTFTTVVLPALQYNTVNIFDSDFILLFIQRAVLIFILGIAFDMRDFNYDRNENIITLPVYYGIKSMQRLLQYSIVLLFILSMLHAALMPRWILFSIDSICYVTICYFIIVKSYKKPSEYYFATAVDGLLMLECIFLFLLFHIF